MMPLAADVTGLAKQVIVACGIILLAVLAAAAAIVWIRRRLRASGSGSPTPWTLEDLQKLRKQGDITEAEYQSMRAALIRAFRGEGPDPSTPVEPHWDWVAEPTSGRGSEDHGPDFDVKK